MTRKFIAMLALAGFSLYALAQVALLSGATSTGAGTAVVSNRAPGSKQFQALGQTTAGTGTAVVTVECSLDGTTWNSTPLGTISLTLGTVTVAEGLTTTDRCSYLRGNVTTITGTGSSATLYMAQ